MQNFNTFTAGLKSKSFTSGLTYFIAQIHSIMSKILLGAELVFYLKKIFLDFYNGRPLTSKLVTLLKLKIIK